jgi:hypothetical protein
MILPTQVSTKALTGKSGYYLRDELGWHSSRAIFDTLVELFSVFQIVLSVFFFFNLLAC